MLEAANEALSFVQGKTREDLYGSRLLALALTRQIEIIGEAASKVSLERRAAIPGIPWHAVTGIRHRAIHAYFDVDLEVIWSTITLYLPALVRELDNALLEG